MAKILVYLMCIISCCFAVDPVPGCNCPNKANCNPVVNWNTADREVRVELEWHFIFQ